jgi:pyruvate dehydrogenase E2 component (dihydrolipoamide acetyltransferase)
VIKRDLEGLPKAAAKTAAAKANAPAKGAVAGAGSWERLPARSEKASSTRKTIARRLSESKRDVPHYYLTVDLDVDALNAARTQLNDALAGAAKVSFNDLVIKASALALRTCPSATPAGAATSSTSIRWWTSRWRWRCPTA